MMPSELTSMERREWSEDQDQDQDKEKFNKKTLFKWQEMNKSLKQNIDWALGRVSSKA